MVATLTCVRVCVCVCVSERDRVCVRKSERERFCLYVRACVCKRERANKKGTVQKGVQKNRFNSSSNAGLLGSIVGSHGVENRGGVF